MSNGPRIFCASRSPSYSPLHPLETWWSGLWHPVHLARELRIERGESLPTGLKAPFTTCELVCCAYKDGAGEQASSPHNEGARQWPGKCQRNNPEKPHSRSASIAGWEEGEECEHSTSDNRHFGLFLVIDSSIIGNNDALLSTLPIWLIHLHLYLNLKAVSWLDLTSISYDYDSSDCCR